MARPLAPLSDLRPANVCLIKPSALGDVVNAFPALSALRALWPEARFSWVINGSLRGLVDGHPEIDQVIVYDRARTGFGPSGLARFVRFLAALRAERFDVAIDLQGLLRSGLMAAATGAPVRVGWADAREGASRFYTHTVVSPLDGAHAVDRLLAVARAFGADVSAPRFAVAMAETDRAWARQALAGVARPRLVLNMGARWETKRWPPEHFAEIARRAVATRGAGLVAVGAPEDRPIVEAFRALLPDPPLLDLCGRTTLPQLAALAAESDVFLSNDSGPLHLAVAAGARVVGVYTCTSAALNGPYGPSALAVETRVHCAASYLTRCPRLECFAELSPDRVWPAVADQFDRRGSIVTAVA
jgi:lipopolysaccharide heptosyltransferase I